MTPLPPLDISSPEAAAEASRVFRKLALRQSLEPSWTDKVEDHANYVGCLLHVMHYPAAHESPALKQLVQEAIDKLEAMLAENA